MFSRRMRSEEHEDLLKKIASLASDVKILEGEMAAMKTNQNALRGLLNRKLDISEEEKKDIKSDDGLDGVRDLTRQSGV